MEEITTKTCPKCGRTMPVSAFGVDKSTRDGLTSRCKACTNEGARDARLRRKKAKEDAKRELEERKATTQTELSKYSPRELMAELYLRGYRGSLSYTKYIDISKINE